MELSEYAREKLTSTHCHLVKLQKNDEYFYGYYNGLSYWGNVEKDGQEVERLETDFDGDENYLPNFHESDFIKNGYEIIPF